MRIHLSKTKANLFAISNVFNSRVVVLNLTGLYLNFRQEIYIMEISQNLGSNALRKVALLITKASDLGMNISGYGEAGENQNSGNVYLWLEDYPFTLYIGLGSDTIYANWTNPNNGEEEDIDIEAMPLFDVEAWANELYNSMEA
jgi:hypothetical protein